MNRAYVFAFRQFKNDGEQKYYSEQTCSVDRLNAAVRHARKIDAEFTFYCVQLDNETYELQKTLDTTNFKLFRKHGYGLPAKA